ncbi:hypoxanthine-guanine phosphoribosyltransferase [Thiotrichales bacterium 19S9-12]|nr:hypoxanthine-guanine phosphoribosyltransferase [Thiotrichales bacterium 19S9-11]MCF6812579.1 hypoxanthine-guanine phosphoribosyltransferase [Thiotrichales bacterium 19S9-12]
MSSTATVPVNHEFIKEVLRDATEIVSEATLMNAFDQMASQITSQLQDKEPLFLCVMNGGFMMAAEVLKRLKFPLKMHYIHATRYNDTCFGSKIEWVKKPPQEIKGREVVLLDDILDGGITLSEIKKFCQSMGAKEVYTAVMLDKKTNREADGLASADFVGLEIPDEYVFGFGLDYHGYLRNIPSIYAAAKHHYV